MLRYVVQDYGVKNTKCIQDILKDLFSSKIQEMLEAELEEHLDTPLHKSLYLATVDISDKWTQKIRNWSQVLAHLSIYFE